MNAPDYLSPSDLDALIARALGEDLGPGGVGGGDVTTLATIPPETTAEATFLLKADGTLAGLAVAERVFAAVDPDVQVRWTAADGDVLAAGTAFGTVSGRARSLLVGERLALNLMQRMSGIATLTARYVAAVADTRAQILDTRKTAPGLRALDKWAVRIGGGGNHRIGLYDRILIKDNHIAASGGIAQAIHAAAHWRAEHARDMLIECEACTLREVRLAAATGLVDVLLLDNFARVDDEEGVFTVQPLELALDHAVRYDPDARTERRTKTEASGGVTLETVAQIAQTGVDFISVGALTHSVQALDISLKIDLHQALSTPPSAPAEPASPPQA
jgi:nicotinate-nucleotide pyrophosphorylase (carboxylating)